MERVAVLSGNCIEFSVINIESKSTLQAPPGFPAIRIAEAEGAVLGPINLFEKLSMT